MWITMLPWWAQAYTGWPVEKLEVRHHMVRAVGTRTAVVHLQQRWDGWTVVGVED
jgi:hypothetical protein